ncbi:MAG: 3-deoxy-manno-octulosonate cytidylyltransferase [Elusimicrobia bacterium]|nr:3-deoxy-manno-octulosonate cytidylyltransferase [Elusimicrobiota bacterium]
MSRVLVVIPARMGSTRFPGKVLARLGGRPMVEWCWRAAVAARLGPVLVATESPKVAAAVRGFGGQAVLTPASCPSGSDRVWQAARGRREVLVLNCQGDMPLLSPATLRAVARELKTGRADIATAVIPLSDERRARDPNAVKAVRSADGRCLYFSRAPVPHPRQGRARRWEHLGVYGYRRAALARFVALGPSPLEKTESLEQLRALEAGMTIRAAVVCDLPVSVDVPADLRRAARILRKGRL